MLRKLLILGLLIFALSGCVGWQAETGPALIMVVREGRIATGQSNDIKEGVACSTNLLGLIAFGDSSIHKAKHDAGIDTVVSVDKRFVNIFSIFGQACTIVHGYRSF